MQFIADFSHAFPPHSVALTMLVVSVVAASGLALGSIKLKGVQLGIPGVMFTGLVIARLMDPNSLDPAVIAFMRDFGLIIFVYAVGVQVGPGFVASLRRNGLPLNLLALGIVLMSAIFSLIIARLTHTPVTAAVGWFAGATTNAPAYGSATEAIKSLNFNQPAVAVETIRTLTGPAFAITYPFGLMGVIVAMILARVLFRADPNKEADDIKAAESHRPAIDTLNIELKNPNLNGLTLEHLEDLAGSGVVISRYLHNDSIKVPTPEATVAVGDVVLAVGPKQRLRDFQLIAGHESSVDLRQRAQHITSRNVLITHREVFGKTVDELHLSSQGVAITRIFRAGVEFTAVGQFRLQFGDRVNLVGERDSLSTAAKKLGDNPRELNVARLLPIFIGIAMGVIIGSFPIDIPSLPAPVKLGLASGPMIVAIVLSRVGRVGPLIWYMSPGASALLRELGIVLFLIAVGLNSGQGFFDTLFSATGVKWLCIGAIITLLPLMIAAYVARKPMKMNYLHICGLMAGSMTSPSLAFTSTMTTSEAPSIAFATVYPLTMILRILIAQLIVLIFRG